MTEKLYYQDSHLFAFDAEILSCEPAENAAGKYAVVLNRTAFFPEGGGQAADTGMILDARVLDTQEKDGKIFHYMDTDLSGAVHSTVSCRIDSDQRFRRMQNHSGEHIVSGLVHNTYGYENVGFHMGDSCMTIDFSGELTWEQLAEIETKANETVYSNLPIRTYFLSPEELGSVVYRSKLDLKENVRIVEIEGIDRCACCAPHVSLTGEIGIIKILSCERHRGGVRVELVCGMDALKDFRLRQESVTEISNLLSAKRNEVTAAVERLAAERDELKFSRAEIELQLVEAIADGFAETDGNIVVFKFLSEPACRELVNRLVPKCGGIAAVFFGSDGAYRYVIGSAAVDLRSKAKEINAAISGRGGGKPEMIMGSCTADEETVRKALRTIG